MSITAKLAQCAAAAVAALALAAPAHGAYGWPVKPFHAQHPVRGFLGDPRIDGTDWLHGTLHFGVDISAADGTAVYATLDGVASPNSLHPDVVIVRGAAGVAHEYWHVVPAVRWSTQVAAFRTVIGYVEAPWKHVHFSEWRDGVYLNPLRPGALTPYRDTTRPTVHLISFERDGAGVGARVSGRLDLVTEAWDEAPLPVPEPWAGKPVVPASVSWRLVDPRGREVLGWRYAVDFRNALPAAPFLSVYARWTTQNHPWPRGVGRYRFYLARGWDTRSVPNGVYRVVVAARDTAGHEGRAERTLTIAN